MRLLVTPSGGQICIKTIERGVGGRGGGRERERRGREGGKEYTHIILEGGGVGGGRIIHTHDYGGRGGERERLRI